MASNGEKSARENELDKVFSGLDAGVLTLVRPLIENVMYIENQLEELRKLPMIQVHPTDKLRQRATPAAKLYKEFVQQHSNCIKALLGVLDKGAQEEESPLRQWLEAKKRQYETR